MPLKTPLTALALALLLAGLLALLAASPAAVQGRPAADDPLLAYVGPDFLLVQEDGPNCGFSGAPQTEGEIILVFDFAGGEGALDVEAGGSGWRRNLRCGDFSGDMFWQATYDITAMGEVDLVDTTFEWTGLLIGSGRTEWANCAENGEPVSCPAPDEGPFDFPVLFRGEVDCDGDIIFGRIDVQQIGLPTYGEWAAFRQAAGGYLAVAQGPGVAINGRPLPHLCLAAISPDDVIELGQQEAAVGIHCEDSDSPLPTVWGSGLVLGPLVDEPVTIEVSQLLDGCDQFAPNKAGAEHDPVLGLDLTAGWVSLLAAPQVGDIQINAGTASALTAGGSRLLVRRDAQTNAATFTCLAGSALVQPGNPALSPVTLAAAQEVSVGADQVGPIQTWQQLRLPLVLAE